MGCPTDILAGVIPRRPDLLDELAHILGEDEELSGSEEVGATRYDTGQDVGRSVHPTA